MAFTAKILSWRFRHLNIVGCLLKRRPTKGGSRAPQDPPPTSYAPVIEGLHSRDQHLCKFIRTKESVYIRKEINSQRIGLEHQHGDRFIILEHQYTRRDVMWKRCIWYLKTWNLWLQSEVSTS